MIPISSTHLQLNNILSELENSSDQEQISRITPILKKTLLTLKSLNLDATANEEKKEISNLLHEIDKKILSNSLVSTKKIENIHRIILSIKKEFLSEKIDFTFAVVSTTGSKDHNGIFALAVKKLIAQKMPFIATRSWLSGTESSYTQPFDLMKEFNADEWDFFSNTGNEANGEVVICIPKALFNGDVSPGRLSQLDLKTDGTLSQISIREAFSGPSGSTEARDITHIFSDSPIKSKMIYLMGHGGVGSPAGLKIEEYKEFLLFCQSQHCKGLLTMSCYSGGKSTLIPLELSREHQQSLSFPILIESLGDWETHFETAYLAPGRLEKIKQLFENPNQLTPANLRKNIIASQTNERGVFQPARYMDNIQMILPHAHESPMGARAIGEDPNSHVITVSDIRRAELNQNENEKNLKITTKGDFDGIVMIHPTVIPLTLEHTQGQDPGYISMIPGQGQHYIKRIRLNQMSSLNWINSFSYIYNSESIGVNKGFFIGHLEDGSEPLEDVVVMFDEAGYQCFYKKQGQYYMFEKNEEHPITPFQYALQTLIISNLTAASEEANRASTGGQQDRKTFLEAVAEKGFWQSVYPQLENITTLSDVELFQIFDQLNDRDDQTNLIFYVLLNDKELRAAELIERGKFRPDLWSFNGAFILNTAVGTNNVSMVKYLLQKGTNPNSFSKPSGLSPLHIAVSMGNVEMTRLLLENEKTNPQLVNHSNNTTPIDLVEDNEEIARLLLQANTGRSSLRQGAFNPLYAQIRADRFQMIELLLANGADPNSGSYSPLFLSIWKNNQAIAKLLLENGADIFAAQSRGGTPFEDCIKYGTPEMLTLFLEHAKTDSIYEEFLNSCFLSALERGNEKVIEILQPIGAKLSENVSTTALVQLVKKFEKASDYLYIRKLFEYMPSDSIRREVAIATANPSLIFYLIDNRVIDPEGIPKIELPSPYFWVIRNNDLAMASSLLQSGINPAITVGSYPIPLFVALKTASPEMAKLLLNEYTGDLSLESQGQSILLSSLQTKDPEIVRIALNRNVPLLNSYSKEIINDALAPFLEKGELQLVSDVFRTLPNEDAKVDLAISLDNPALLRLLINQDQIHLNTPLGVNATSNVNLPSSKTLFSEMLILGSRKISYDSQLAKLFLWSLRHGGIVTEDLILTAIGLTKEWSFDPSIRIKWLNLMVQNGSKDLIVKLLPALLNVDDPKLAEFVLNLSDDLNQPYSDGEYVIEKLMTKINPKKMEIIRSVIQKGANINLHKEDNLHPVVRCIFEGGNAELVQFLFENGAKLTTQKEVNFAFGVAYARGLPSLISVIANQGHKSEASFWKDKVSYLEGAYTIGDFDFFKYGLESLQIEMDIVPKGILEVLVLRNDTEMLEYLLKNSNDSTMIERLNELLTTRPNPVLSKLIEAHLS